MFTSNLYLQLITTINNILKSDTQLLDCNCSSSVGEENLFVKKLIRQVIFEKRLWKCVCDESEWGSVHVYVYKPNSLLSVQFLENKIHSLKYKEVSP